MAKLQRTLASNSIWIGTGPYHTDWQNYSTDASKAFAIYASDIPLLHFATSSGYNDLVFNTKSDQVSSIYRSGGMTGEGFRIFADPKIIGDQTRLRWTGEFDDLVVRGSLNVYQFVINQIRATNGSLWVSDAGKAISMSQGTSADQGIIYFETSSMLPFSKSDLVRSRRWLAQGAEIQGQWDVVFEVTKTDFAKALVTVSTVNGDFFTSSNITSLANFYQTVSVYGADFVRVGSTDPLSNRQGAVYLTSNDIGGPFLDVVNDVDSINKAIGGTSLNTTESLVKARLGNLQGIYDTQFGGFLHEYGLYSTNVYLKGTISATAGTFSGLISATEGNIGGWLLSQNQIYSGLVTLSSIANQQYIGFGANTFSADNGIYIGRTASTWGLSVKNSDATRYLTWDGIDLLIRSPYFTLSNGTANLIGGITASYGLIGGWTISSGYLNSINVRLSSATGDEYLGINATSYNTNNGIYIGQNGAGKWALSAINSDGTKYLKWSGTQLLIASPNFTLSGNNANIVGGVTASYGYIGDWIIKDGKLYSGPVTLSASSTDKYLGIGASSYETSPGIYIGSSNAGYRASFINNGVGLYWDGTNLGISTSNVTLSQGNLYARNAVISGSISASAGQIDGWTIQDKALSSLNSSGGQVRLATSGSYIDIIDSLHDFNDNAFSSLRYNSISVYSEVGTSFTTSTGFQTTSMVRNDCVYTPIYNYTNNKGVAVTQSYDSGWKAVVFWSHTNSVISNGNIADPAPIWSGSMGT